jgi:hypothetical protein
VNGQQYLYPLSTGTVLGQASIAVEFAATLGTHASFRAPHDAILVAQFHWPVPPPGRACPSPASPAAR